MNDIFALSREKWRELPAGGETLARTFSSDLAALDDAALLARWRAMEAAAKVMDVRGWFHELYVDTFAGRHVVEVGSGYGIDGVHFLRHGAHWTFSDLVKENLELMRRVVALLGLSDRARFLHVEDEHAYARLEGPVDVVWAIGSLHHVPFQTARVESLDLLRQLKRGGRWIELTYPYERWLREGAPAFTEFGKLTDGERTPWAEWYDLEKVKMRLFPSRTSTILDFSAGGGNFGWVDLRIDEPATVAHECRQRDLMGLPGEARNGAILKASPGQWQLECPEQMWWYAMTIDIEAAVQELDDARPYGRAYAVDVELYVETGSIGIALTAADVDTFLGREQLVDARPSLRRMTVCSATGALPKYVLIRNTARDVASRVRVISASLRLAA